MLKFTNEFFSKKRFPSSGWFIKEIIPDAADAIRKNPKGWLNTIRSSSELVSYFKSTKRRRIELTLAVRDYDAGKLIGDNFGGRGPALTALILVGLLRLIAYDPNTDVVIPNKEKWIREFLQFDNNYRKFFSVK